MPEKVRIIIRVSLMLANIAALVMAIIGYETNMDMLVNAVNHPNREIRFNSLVQAAYALYVAITAFLLLAVFFYVIILKHVNLTFATLLFALAFMIVRSSYYLYLAFSDNPYNTTLAERIVLQYLMEMLTVLSFSLVGLDRSESYRGHVYYALRFLPYHKN